MITTMQPAKIRRFGTPFSKRESESFVFCLLGKAPDHPIHAVFLAGQRRITGRRPARKDGIAGARVIAPLSARVGRGRRIDRRRSGRYSIGLRAELWSVFVSRTQPRMTPTQVHKPTVFVVDDDRQMRESLVTLITAMRFPARGFPSAGSFHNIYKPSMPGCLVLDINMPVQNGLELYEQLIREGKRLPVIYMTAYADVSTAVTAMKTGAIEFLEKPFDRGTLLERIRKALALDADWRRREADFNALDARMSQLSERERETLRLIQTGDSNKAMATRLYISERAVEMRRAAIMRKLQIRSLAQLLELATTHRILCDIVQTRSDLWRGF